MENYLHSKMTKVFLLCRRLCHTPQPLFYATFDQQFYSYILVKDSLCSVLSTSGVVHMVGWISCGMWGSTCRLTKQVKLTMTGIMCFMFNCSLVSVATMACSCLYVVMYHTVYIHSACGVELTSSMNIIYNYVASS